MQLKSVVRYYCSKAIRAIERTIVERRWLGRIKDHCGSEIDQFDLDCDRGVRFRSSMKKWMMRYSL